jgi:hypothetical protein
MLCGCQELRSYMGFDSRLWGCVPEALIYGKVTKIYYPFNRIGKLQFNQVIERGK